MIISRPSFVSLANPSELDAAGYLYQEKLDGRWHQQEIGGSLFVGELLRSGFVPFDVPFVSGQDLRHEPFYFRLEVLRDECRRLNLQQIATGHGSEFFQAVIAKGGEGVVMKPADSYFGYGWVKCKRVETFDCVVVEKHPAKMSVRLELNGEDCGWCPALFSVFDRVTVGSIVEVAAYGRHASGKFREARIERVRVDKSPVLDGRRLLQH